MQPALSAAPPASFWRRLGAMVYDSLAIIGLWFLVGGIAVGLHHGEALPAADFAFQALLLFTTYAYFAFCWRRGGQTLGMKTWRIRVVSDAEGGVLRWGQTLVRFGAGLLAWLPAGFGHWSALFHPQGLAWSDRASGTRLVKVI